MTKQEQATPTRLDSGDATRYVWLFWSIIGIHPFKKHRTLYWLYSVLLNFCCSAFFIAFYAVTFFVVSDLLEILANLSVMVPLIYNTAKQLVIFYHIRRTLPQAALHLHALDRRAEQEPAAREQLKRLVQLSHRIFLTALTGIGICLTLYAMGGILRHRLPFDGWLPLDWEHSVGAYVAACAYQLFCLIVQCIAALCNDTYTVIYLLLLATHLRILNARIASLGHGECTEVENYRQLAACVRDHWACMNFYNSIRPAIAATLFIQFFSTAITLCTSAVAFVNAEDSVAQLFKFLPHLLVVVCEILPCCWLMDKAALEMQDLTKSLFACRWYEQNQKFRRSLLIFMQRSQKVEKILAGDLVPVSLETFVNIIKFAFSLFTLLNQIKSK
ncbi:odorant receptor 2a-like [Ceratitis capitata]|uniref:odorant receptor 2a-like n=1 Tax=Ceratitis capitata TaxID=7213 RepID=UPI000A103D35|nr:odorant receptor 2a-like [Ceratitis capitata]